MTAVPDPAEPADPPEPADPACPADAPTPVTATGPADPGPGDPGQGQAAATAAGEPRGPAAGEPFDLLGVGIGPFNLSLAALADGVPELRTAFYDQRPGFRWHPGLLIEGATLQVPFLADLVTLVDPASRWSFLNHLKNRDRLFPFYFAERFHVHRAEYDAYCRWVAQSLPSTYFGRQVDSVRWNHTRGLFELDHTHLDAHGEAEALGRSYARHLVVGIGTEPYVPGPLRPLAATPAVPVVHSSRYLDERARLLAADHVTVVGSGQSGAEVFLDLLRGRPPGAERLTWLTRSPAFAPMEYSKLGLEHFTPDYTRYFHGLAEPVRDRLLPRQWQLHKGIDTETITAIHGELYRRTLDGGWPDAVIAPGVAVRTAGRLGGREIELHLEHTEQGTRSRLVTSAVVLATGYRERPLDRLLAPLEPYIRTDAAGRPLIDARYRIETASVLTGRIYVQNAERHTHGVGTPDLGLAAWRSAVVLNDLTAALTGREHFRLPARTAFTSFGLAGPATAPGAAAADGGAGARAQAATRTRALRHG